MSHVGTLEFKNSWMSDADMLLPLKKTPSSIIRAELKLLPDNALAWELLKNTRMANITEKEKAIFFLILLLHLYRSRG